MSAPVRLRELLALALLSVATFPLIAQNENDSAIAGQGRGETRIDGITFSLPDGYTLQRVADESLVKWPIVADWDAQGRFVVVESGGAAKPIEEHNKQLLHRVVRLIDDDGDGRFDRRLLAADQLPFSEGVLCVGDSLLVAAPPHIWKLTDANGDGFCEQREIWFDGQTITGCANDLHGPYLGRDGWVYWCKGAFAEQTHELLDGSILKDKAAHIYRRRITGGPIDPVMSGGMANPVEVAFTPDGERFFTSTFLQRPGNGLRDGIAHAVYGGVYGMDQPAIEPLMKTGPLMPIMTHLGAAAPSGLICLQSDALCPPLEHTGQQTLVAALFNLQKVTAHRLLPAGASFATQDLDLLVADRVDFHPTDILEDADGSLLVVDTGGWYDLCCPTSRVDQKTASGGIYRLRRQTEDAPPSQNQERSIDWAQLSTSECIQRLDDPRPWISRMANLTLAGRKDVAGRSDAVQGLKTRLDNKSLTLDQRLHSLWALSSVGSDQALAIIASALESDQPSLVQAACQAIALHRYRPAKSMLEALLTTPARQAQSRSAALTRTAAEALGRIGDSDSVSALFAQLPTAAGDRVLEHSLLYALLEINLPAALAAYLDSESSGQRRAAMQLLDTLEDNRFLQREKLLAALSSPDASERDTAAEILAHHPEWSGPSILELLVFWEQAVASGAEPSSSVVTLLGAWSRQPSVQLEISPLISRYSAPATKSKLVTLLSQCGGEALPEAWVLPLTAWLKQDPQTVAALLAKFDLSPEYCQCLWETLDNLTAQSNDLDFQLALLMAKPDGMPLGNDPLGLRLIQLFTTEEESGNRTEVAQVLMRLSVDRSAAEYLLQHLSQLSPRDLPVAVEAIANAGVDELDNDMLRQLASLPAARGLTADQLQNPYRNRSQELRKLALATAQQLEQPTEDIERQLQAVLDTLLPGDPVRGLQVFRSSKAACSACHQMGYIGGKIGPELTRIGRSRTRSALLEAMLYPSSRIEQSYQPVRVLTEDGQVYNGLVTQHFEDGFQLQLTADKTVLVGEQEVLEQRVSQVSIMPGGLGQLLTEQELADLLALLESAR